MPFAHHSTPEHRHGSSPIISRYAITKEHLHMSPSSSPHITCAVFNEIPEALTPNIVHHFIVGQDEAPTAFSPADARARLGDAFAQEVLLNGKFPRSGGEVLAELAQLTGRDDQIDRHRFFLLGEGSQIPFSQQTRSLSRGLRFLVACGRGKPDGPDIFVSAFHPDEGDVELMAWDRKVGGFNFYRTVGANSGWVFAGNSRQALSAPTQGNGPFESHRSGNLLMKELSAPWIHWESPDAHIPTTVFGPTNRLAQHPWFTALEGGGAFICETDVARPSITRWTRLRFDEIAQAGQVNDPQRILVHVLGTPAVNIVSSSNAETSPAVNRRESQSTYRPHSSPTPRHSCPERMVSALTLRNHRFRCRATSTTPCSPTSMCAWNRP
jgi:hypothetical protein